MRQFFVIQHSHHEFLGTIEKQLEHREIGFVYIRPFLGQSVPGTPQDKDALFLLAGPMDPTEKDDFPYLTEEEFLAGQFLKNDQPVVGIGLGAQLLAEHYGGAASEDPELTAEFVTARKTEAGEGDALAEELDGQEVFLWHAGSVTLPEGVAPTLVDERDRWLAFRPHPMAYALLFRPEIKPGMIEDMVMEDRPCPEGVGNLLEYSRASWGAGRMQAVTDKVVMALVKELALMQPHAQEGPGYELNVRDD
ncbi:type 1 glutamine amidotransferase [Thiohalorhabdus methylotrophus]|uniref:Type 1 glutamine amidotransferase n=1 Tax=Thiohalorhabdus methylotrophus TaxID=3242694 RepID=A0ABV4TRE9_9GAMM